jgi:hypothetical protein
MGGAALLVRLAVMRNEDFDVDEEQVREWLRLASLEKINIFMDHNKIIKLLCVVLLTEWGKDPWKARR